MSNEKDLSTEVKNILHGEILCPEDNKSSTSHKAHIKAHIDAYKAYKISKEKDISVDFKTVLHGEVLGPAEEPPKKSKEQKEIEILKAKLAQKEAEREAYIAEEVRRRNLSVQQYYGNVSSMNQQLGGQFGYSQSNLFGCMHHYTYDGVCRCQNCGRY
jgi:hypothetical protein